MTKGELRWQITAMTLFSALFSSLTYSAYGWSQIYPQDTETSEQPDTLIGHPHAALTILDDLEIGSVPP